MTSAAIGRKRSIVLRLLGVMAIAATPAAVAQELTPEERRPSLEDCKVPPQQERQDRTEEGADGNRQSARNLSDCEGVLRPPPEGDPDIVEEPPATGETPIITPEQLPGQQDSE